MNGKCNDSCGCPAGDRLAGLLELEEALRHPCQQTAGPVVRCGKHGGDGVLVVGCGHSPTSEGYLAKARARVRRRDNRRRREAVEQAERKRLKAAAKAKEEEDQFVEFDPLIMTPALESLLGALGLKGKPK